MWIFEGIYHKDLSASGLHNFDQIYGSPLSPPCIHRHSTSFRQILALKQLLTQAQSLLTSIAILTNVVTVQPHNMIPTDLRNDWKTCINDITHKCRILKEAIGTSLSTRLDTWVKQFESYQQEQFGEFCFYRADLDDQNAIQIQLPNYSDLLAQYSVCVGFGFKVTNFVKENAAKLSRLLQQRQQLEYFLNQYRILYNTIKPIYTECLNTYSSEVDRCLESGLKVIKWMSPSLDLFVKQCLQAISLYQLEYNQLFAVHASYTLELHTLRSQLVFHFPQTLLHEDAFEDFLEQTLSKRMEDLRACDERLNHIKEHTLIRAADRNLNLIAVEAFFDTLEANRNTILENFATNTLSYVLNCLQTDAPLIELPLMCSNGEVYFHLRCSDEESEDSINLVELFDLMIVKLSEISDCESSEGVSDIVPSMSSLLIRSEKNCIAFKDRLVSQFSFVWKDNPHTFFEGFLRAPMNPGDEPFLNGFPESFHDFAAICLMLQEKKNAWNKKNGILLLMIEEVNPQERLEALRASTPIEHPYSEYRKRAKQLNQVNDGINKLPSQVPLGWICINIVSFKREVFLLLSKWGLPFAEFTVNEISAYVSHGMALISIFRRSFDPSFSHITTAQKIDLINTTRRATVDATKMDVFFSTARLRLKQAEQFRVPILDPVYTKLDAFEKEWKHFFRNEMKTFTDHIQQIERDVFNDLSEREQIVKMQTTAIKLSLSDPTQTPMLDDLDPTTALEMLKKHRIALSAVEKQSSEICSLRKSLSGGLVSHPPDLIHCVTVIDSLDSLWCLIQEMTTYLDGYLFPMSWTTFTAENLTPQFFNTAHTTLLSMREALQNYPVYRSFENKIRQYKQVWIVLNDLKSTPFEVRYWIEILNYFNIPPTELYRRQQEAVDGTIHLRVFFETYDNENLSGIETFLLKSKKQLELFQKLTEIVDKWAKTPFPINPLATSNILPLILSEIEKSSRRSNQPVNPFFQQQHEQIYHINAPLCLANLGEAEDDIFILANMMTLDHSCDYRQMIEATMDLLTQIMIFLNVLCDFEDTLNTFTSSIQNGIISLADKSVLNVAISLLQITPNINAMKAITGPSNTELCIAMDHINQDARNVLASSPKDMILAIAENKPRFLMLTANEIVNYLSGMTGDPHYFTIPVNILRIFMPGTQRIVFEIPKEKKNVLISCLIGTAGEILSFDEEAVGFGNDIWNLPHVLYQTCTQFIRRQLDDAVESTTTNSSSFFEWFGGLLVQYSSVENYPLLVQVFVSTIYIWYTSLVRQIQEDINHEDDTTLIEAVLTLNNNVNHCLAFLMNVQRIRYPLWKEKRVVNMLYHRHCAVIQETLRTGTIEAAQATADIIAADILIQEDVANVETDKPNQKPIEDKIRSGDMFGDFDDVDSSFDDANRTNASQNTSHDTEKSKVPDSILDTTSILSTFRMIVTRLIYLFQNLANEQVAIIERIQKSGHNLPEQAIISVTEPPATQQAPKHSQTLIKFSNTQILPFYTLYFDKQSQQYYSNFPIGDIMPNMTISQKRLVYGLEWVSSCNSLPVIPYTTDTLEKMDVILSALSNTNATNSQICGCAVYTTEEERSTNIQLLHDTAHLFGRNLFVFNCSILTTAEQIKSFLLSTLVDSHFILFDNLHRLPELVLHSLVDFLKLLINWRNKHHTTQSGFTEIDIEGMKTTITLPLSDWFVVGTFVVKEPNYNKLPFFIEDVFVPVTFSPPDPTPLLAMLLTGEGFVFAEQHATRLITFFQSLISLMQYEFKSTSRQFNSLFLSFSFLASFAKEAGHLHRITLSMPPPDAEWKSTRVQGAPHFHKDKKFQNTILQLEEGAIRAHLLDTIKKVVSICLPLNIIHPQHTSTSLVGENTSSLVPIVTTIQSQIYSFFPVHLEKNQSRNQVNISSLQSVSIPHNFQMHVQAVLTKSGYADESQFIQQCYAVFKAIENNTVSVISGPTGAGKATVLEVVRMIQQRFNMENPEMLMISQEFLYEQLTIHLFCNKISHGGHMSVFDAINDKSHRPIWLIVPIDNARPVTTFSFFFEEIFGATTTTDNGIIEFSFYTHEKIVLPPNSKLIFVVSSPIFDLPSAFYTHTSLVHISFPTITTMNWILSTWMKEVVGTVLPTEHAQATGLLFRMLLTKCMQFLKTQSNTSMHTIVSRIPTISILKTALSIFTAALRLFSVQIVGKFDIFLIRMLLIFCIFWAGGGHLESELPSISQFEDWMSEWKRKHSTPLQLKVTPVMDDDGNESSRRQTDNKTRSDFDVFVRSSFGNDVEFGKLGTVFDYSVDLDEKQPTYISNPNTHPVTFSMLIDHPPRPLFGTFTPFLALCNVCRLSLIGDRPVLLLNDKFIGRQSIAQAIAEVMVDVPRFGLSQTSALRRKGDLKQHPFVLNVTQTAIDVPNILYSKLFKSVALRQCIPDNPDRPLVLCFNDSYSDDSDMTQPQNSMLSAFLDSIFIDEEYRARASLVKQPLFIVASDRYFFNQSVNVAQTSKLSVFQIPEMELNDFVSLASALWDHTMQIRGKELFANNFFRSEAELHEARTFFISTLVTATMYLHLSFASSPNGLQRPTINAYLEVINSICSCPVPLLARKDYLFSLWLWECLRVYSVIQWTTTTKLHAMKLIYHVYSTFLQQRVRVSSDDRTESVTDRSFLLFDHTNRSLPLFYEPSNPVENNLPNCFTIIPDSVSSGDAVVLLNMSQALRSRSVANVFLMSCESIQKATRPILYFDAHSLTALSICKTASYFMGFKLFDFVFPSIMKHLIYLFELLAEAIGDLFPPSAIRPDQPDPNLTCPLIEMGIRTVRPTFVVALSYGRSCSFTHQLSEFLNGLFVDRRFFASNLELPEPDYNFRTSSHSTADFIKFFTQQLIEYYFQKYQEVLSIADICAIVDRLTVYGRLIINVPFATQLVVSKEMPFLSSNAIHIHASPTDKEALKQIAENSLQPLFGILSPYLHQKMISFRVQKSALSNKDTTLKDAIVETLASLFLITRKHDEYSAQGTVFNIKQEESDIGHLQIRPPSTLSFVEFVHSFSRFLLYKVKYLQNTITVTESAVTTLSSFRQATELFKQNLKAESSSLQTTTVEKQLQETNETLNEIILLYDRQIESLREQNADLGLGMSSVHFVMNDPNLSLYVKDYQKAMTSIIDVKTHHVEELVAFAVYNADAHKLVNSLLLFLSEEDDVPMEWPEHSFNDLLGELWSVDIFDAREANRLRVEYILVEELNVDDLPQIPQFTIVLYKWLQSIVALASKFASFPEQKQTMFLGTCHQILLKMKLTRSENSRGSLQNVQKEIQSALKQVQNNPLCTDRALQNGQQLLVQGEEMMLMASKLNDFLENVIEDTNKQLRVAIGSSIITAFHFILNNFFTPSTSTVLIHDFAVPILQDNGILFPSVIDPLYDFGRYSSSQLVMMAKKNGEGDLNDDRLMSFGDIVRNHRLPYVTIPQTLLEDTTKGLLLYADTFRGRDSFLTQPLMDDANDSEIDLNLFIGADKTAQLSFSSGDRKMVDHLAFILYHAGWFARLLGSPSLNRVHSATSSFSGTLLPNQNQQAPMFPSQVKVTLFFDPLEVILPSITHSMTASSTLYHVYDIQHPATSPFVISLRDPSFLQKMHDVFQMLQDLHQQNVNQKTVPLRRNAIFFTDVCDQTTSYPLLFLLAQYRSSANSLLTRGGFYDYTSIHIGSTDFTVKLMKADTKACWRTEEIVSYTISCDVDLILVADRTSTSTFTSPVFIDAAPRVIVPDEWTVQTTLLEPTGRIVTECVKRTQSSVLFGEDINTLTPNLMRVSELMHQYSEKLSEATTFILEHFSHQLLPLPVYRDDILFDFIQNNFDAPNTFDAMDAISEQATLVSDVYSQSLVTHSVFQDHNTGEELVSSLKASVILFSDLIHWKKEANEQYNTMHQQLYQIMNKCLENDSKLKSGLSWLRFCYSWTVIHVHPFLSTISPFVSCLLRQLDKPFTTNKYVPYGLTYHSLVNTIFTVWMNAMEKEMNRVSGPAQGKSFDGDDFINEEKPFSKRFESDNMSNLTTESRHALIQSHLSTDINTSPVGLSEQSRQAVSGEFTRNIIETMCSIINDTDSLLASFFDISYTLACQTGEPLQRNETLAFLYPLNLLINDVSASLGLTPIDPSHYHSPTFSFLEVTNLLFPAMTAVVQTAGLLPLNPVPSFIPESLWKNIFIFGLICPAFRPFVTDLEPHCQNVYSLIDHMKPGSLDPGIALQTVYFSTSVLNTNRGRSPALEKRSQHGGMGRQRSMLELTTQRQQRLQQTHHTSNSLKGIHLQQPENTRKGIPFTRESFVLHSEYTPFGSVRIQPPNLEVSASHTRIRMFNETKEKNPFSSYSFTPEPKQTLTTKVIDSSSPLLTNIQRKWADWMRSDAPELISFPNSDLNTLNQFQRVLFFNVVRPDRLRHAIRIAIAASPAFGPNVAYFDSLLPSSSSTVSPGVSHPSQPGTNPTSLRMSINPSPSMYCGIPTLNRLYLKPDHTTHLTSLQPEFYDPFFQMIILECVDTLGHAPVSFTRLHSDLASLATVRDRKLVTIRLSESFRSTMNSLVNSARRIDVLTESAVEYVWERTWEHIKQSFDSLISKEPVWIVLEGIELATMSFIGPFIAWLNTLALQNLPNSVHLDHEVVFWILGLPNFEVKDRATFKSMDRISKLFYIRQPKSFRGTLASSLIQISPLCTSEALLNRCRHYDPSAQKDSPITRTLLYLVFSVVVCHSLFVEYFRTLSHLDHSFRIALTEVSLERMVKAVLATPTGTTARRARDQGSALPVSESIVWMNVIQKIKTVAYPHLSRFINQELLDMIVDPILEYDAFISSGSLPILPGIPFPTEESSFTSINQYFSAVLSASTSRSRARSLSISHSLAQRCLSITLGSSEQLRPLVPVENGCLLDPFHSDYSPFRHNLISMIRALHHLESIPTKFVRQDFLIASEGQRLSMYINIRIGQEIKELSQPTYFDIDTITKLLIGLYSSESSIPPTLLCLLREANLHNALLSHIFDYVDNLPTISKAMVSGTANSSLSLYASEDKQAEFFSQLLTRSSTFLKTWISISQNVVPTNWRIVTHSTRTTLFHTWLNFVIGGVQQIHRIFSFIPINQRLRDCVTVGTTTSTQLKGERAMKNALYVVPYHLLRPKAFLNSLIQEIVMSLNTVIMSRLDMDHNSLHRRFIRLAQHFDLTSHLPLDTQTIAPSLFASLAPHGLGRSKLSTPHLNDSTTLNTTGHSLATLHGVAPSVPDTVRFLSFCDVSLRLIPTTRQPDSLASVTSSSFIYRPLNSVFFGGVTFSSKSGHYFSMKQQTVTISPSYFPPSIASQETEATVAGSQILSWKSRTQMMSANLTQNLSQTQQIQSISRVNLNKLMVVRPYSNRPNDIDYIISTPTKALSISMFPDRGDYLSQFTRRPNQTTSILPIFHTVVCVKDENGVVRSLDGLQVEDDTFTQQVFQLPLTVHETQKPIPRYTVVLPVKDKKVFHGDYSINISTDTVLGFL
ncbi:hypothetical protein BLNAU_2481 [Blattamonas nauphoetae]|uniref:Dynein heavy chain linker domain-containing protein n=1 Tax=Blattamonas nauphoetae TaxID=2049346 RepID=A0ABQ9YG21_9EUKA|nr:hypothetical protein BLNAU_2481 [Blattamonas nauphoetae]